MVFTLIKPVFKRCDRLEIDNIVVHSGHAIFPEIVRYKRKQKRNCVVMVLQRVVAHTWKNSVYLLKNTKLKMNAIARSVGYENTAYFYRIFAKSFGKTPKDYQNEALCKKEYHL